MGETFADLVTDGPLLVAAAVAALVGLISFASPCVLPLVPGYLSYVTGLVGSGATAATAAPPASAAATAGSGATTATGLMTTLDAFTYTRLRVAPEEDPLAKAHMAARALEIPFVHRVVSTRAPDEIARAAGALLAAVRVHRVW